MKFSNYFLYRKIFRYNVLLIICSILIISILLFNIFGNLLINSLNKQVIKQLNNVSYIFELTNEQIWEIYTSTYLNREISSYLSLNKPDPIMEYKAYMELKTYQNLMPYISYIGVYNSKTNKFLNTKGLDEKDYQDLISLDNFKDAKITLFEPVTFYYPYDEREDENINNVLCSFFKTGLNDDAIVICVDRNHVSNNIRKVHDIGEGNTFIINKSGVIISDAERNFFNNPIQPILDMEGILDSTASEDYFIKKIDGVRSLVSYVRPDNSNWTYIHIHKLKDILSDIYVLAYVILIVCFILILIFIFVSKLLTDKIYSPINRLVKNLKNINIDQYPEGKVNEVELLLKEHDFINYRLQTMEKTISDNNEIIIEKVLIYLLKGIYSGLPKSLADNSDIKMELDSEKYKIMVFKMDSFSEIKDKNNFESLEVIKYVVTNIINEILVKKYKVKIVEVEFNCFALILFLAEEEQNDYREYLFLIQKVIKENFDIELSFGLSPIISKLDEFHRSFFIAKRNLDYTFIFGSSSIIDTERIEDRIKASPKYPYSMEKDIIEFINLSDKERLLDRIKLFINEISGFSYDVIKDYSRQLLDTILSVFHNELINLSDWGNYHSFINKISDSESIEQLEKEISLFCLSICDRSLNKTATEHKKIVEDIVLCVDDNFVDSELCIDMFIDEFGLSKDYLASIFKNYQKESFNEYLNKVRIRKAGELLLETNLSVSSISKKVGINNTSYFYTLFKRMYGMTPSSYRRRMG